MLRQLGPQTSALSPDRHEKVRSESISRCEQRDDECAAERGSHVDFRERVIAHTRAREHLPHGDVSSVAGAERAPISEQTRSDRYADCSTDQ
jgi:hypothetical protein